ncbi:hypothetical protein [Plastoroseomonas hellenica]|uniref:hypothetical protein n=1 Tax=Plastoroseomonas hellenica TaxID=2687306 RepID=UPI001BAC5D13|nr:hypothetical protein [Plastoroseomonas hellenica]MBR0644019.1 hypothetical protein [Plastoroseomonas hellenica]
MSDALAQMLLRRGEATMLVAEAAGRPITLTIAGGAYWLHHIPANTWAFALVTAKRQAAGTA